MKTLALYLLTLISPAGESYVLDSHLTLEDCGTAIAAGFASIYIESDSGAGQIVPVPEGATYICEVMK
jgi:hypothetical protein